MPSSDVDLSSAKSEIAFFMERAWQTSFGYFAGATALLAVGASDGFSAFASSMGVTTPQLLAAAAAITNPLYLGAVIACLYAVLKRGLFIIAMGEESHDRSHLEWERFVRSEIPGRWRAWESVSWNIDNYYMLPTMLVVAVGSAWAVIVAVGSSSGALQLLGIVGLLLHVVPAAMLVALGQLNTRCRRAIATRPAA
jgi:hypothetical protein